MAIKNLETWTKTGGLIPIASAATACQTRNFSHQKLIILAICLPDSDYMSKLNYETRSRRKNTICNADEKNFLSSSTFSKYQMHYYIYFYAKSRPA